jgi:hypothetical protein
MRMREGVPNYVAEVTQVGYSEEHVSKGVRELLSRSIV